jgi:hypothetical protein
VKRLERAIHIRDVVVEWLRKNGQLVNSDARQEPGELPGFRSHVAAKIGDFQVSWRTPFSKSIRPPSGYLAALIKQAGVKPTMECGLDIWQAGRGKHGNTGKVMNIEWDSRTGEVHLVSFRAGDWAREITELVSGSRL